ncbi:MAG: PD-(D/E)XK nuclease family protein [Planctomycetota bacterium]
MKHHSQSHGNPRPEMPANQLFDLFYCERVFVGWDQPFSHSAAEYLVDRFWGDDPSRSERLDLSGWTCVLPSAQSVLGFRKALGNHCDASGLELVAPQIIPVGELAESLYQPRTPLAIEFEQTLAWVRVLRRQVPGDLEPLLPVQPESESLGAWMEIASTLRRLESDLAGECLSFSDVVDATETASERRRWELLTRLLEQFHTELARAGVSDPHLARAEAIEEGRVRSENSIALLGCSDLSESLARLLRDVNREVLSLVAAPSSEASRFDWLGRVVADGFLEFELPLRDEQLISAGGIADQAVAVAEVVEKFREDGFANQVAVGVTDESQVAPIEMQLDAADRSTYRHLGWTVSETALGRFVEALSVLLARPTWQSLAAFVRHGDVHRRLTCELAETDEQTANRNGDDANAAPDFLVALDGMLAGHFPVFLDDELPAKAVADFPVATRLRDIVMSWLAPLREREKHVEETPLGETLTTYLPKRLPIGAWCGHVLHVVDRVFATITQESADHRRLTVEALSTVRELFGRFHALNERLDLPVTSSTAMEILTGRLVDLRVGVSQTPDDIPIHGWLDLALNDAQAMIVCGLNHPFVPASVTGDPFLPGQLRSKLRLADNDRRYARDVYAMQLMISTRREVRFIVGKTAADRSPTPPSRLLAAAPQEAIARRMRSLIPAHSSNRHVRHRWETDCEESQFPIPSLAIEQCPVKSLSVTAFRTYLECPYRFYLRHVLKLKPLDDSAVELAANQFGDLVHAAVEEFGLSDDRDATDPEKIFESMRDSMHQYAEQRFGERGQSAVRFQVRQAERRLRFVAEEQSKRAQAGWRIHATEKAVTEADGAAVRVGNREMGLRGRFDRIDYHPETDRWAILDYKTHGSPPRKKHLRWDVEANRFEWIDLQLPLYRMMAPFLGIDADAESIQLGYFNVSDKAAETRVNIAEFKEDELREADRLIHECVKRILSCDFAPTTERVVFDDYQMILQTGVASRLLATEEKQELETAGHEFSDD